MQRLLAVLGLLLVTCTARAESAPPLPADQWDEETSLWLARAMVSEADWSQVDHAAVAWVLFRRWEAKHKRVPTWRFLDQVKAYCKGLRDTANSPRNLWVKSLSNDDTTPQYWPPHLKWEGRYRWSWARTRAIANSWGAGEIKDPCRGRAMHWGGPMDHHNNGAPPVNCGMTQNIFYR